MSAIAALAHPFLNPGNLPLLQAVRLQALRLLYRDNSEITAMLANFVSKAGTDSVGGFTEASLMEFRVSWGRKLRLARFGEMLKRPVFAGLLCEREVR